MKWIWVAAVTVIALAGWTVGRHCAEPVSGGDAPGSAGSSAEARGVETDLARTTCVRVGATQLLLVTTPEGTAVFDFTKFGARDAPTTYRWRYQSVDQLPEQSGTGSLFEVYNAAKIKSEEMTGADRRRLTAGSVSLSWSYGSPQFGWIYLQTDTTDYIELHDDGRFATIKIGKHEETLR